MGQVLTKYNAKSPKQSSNRLNFIAKTINLVHLGIAIIYGWIVLYSVQYLVCYSTAHQCCKVRWLRLRISPFFAVWAPTVGNKSKFNNLYNLKHSHVSHYACAQTFKLK